MRLQKELFPLCIILLFFLLTFDISCAKLGHSFSHLNKISQSFRTFFPFNFFLAHDSQLEQRLQRWLNLRKFFTFISSNLLKKGVESLSWTYSLLVDVLGRFGDLSQNEKQITLLSTSTKSKYAQESDRAPFFWQIWVKTKNFLR